LKTKRVKILNIKLAIFIDETSDISNEKCIIFIIGYVDPKTLDIRSQLIKLINIDAKIPAQKNCFVHLSMKCGNYRYHF